ncbi:Small ubiquitin- modifier 1 [Rhizophlyctis rosea]|uniref:Small ubiquitin- modifier 1 n=1 Tax=Rhizophlyctis rosea TaxID=64517 RepID=A0AAD5SJL4_9FUNG|nr:Small ubiquitin- modifier 1 [Rhizophlyctis rosea]
MATDNAAGNPELISLKVTSQDNEIFFKIKTKTPLKKLMQTYCERQGKQIDQVRFLFDGQRIQAEQTPDELGMEDGDSIEVMTEQLGGM